MPRYSYVVAFPVLIAICVGVNIQRYPAVSAMLRGESVESRWLGRSEVFDFQAKQTAESKSYQGYRSDSDSVTDSRASRVPIPLSDSLSSPTSSIPVSSASSSQSTLFSRSTPASQSGATGVSSKSSSSTDRDSYSWQSDSYESRPNNSGSIGLTDTYSSSPAPYNYSSHSDPYSHSYGDSSRNSHSTSSFPAWDEYSGNDDQPEDRNDTMNNTEDRSESRASSDDRYSQPEYYDRERARGSARENTFRRDSPLPGYSSQYPAPDDAASTPTTSIPGTSTATVTSNVTDIVTATVTDTEPAPPQTRRPLSLQEKLELRLATPFSFSPAASQDASYDQYIPPDFLPPHENGIVGKLINPSEPAVTISPITFVSATTPDATTPDSTSSDLQETTTSSPEPADESGEVMP